MARLDLASRYLRAIAGIREQLTYLRQAVIEREEYEATDLVKEIASRALGLLLELETEGLPVTIKVGESGMHRLPKPSMRSDASARRR